MAACALPVRVFRARTRRVLRPDTISADIDIGFGIRITRNVVLLGLDVPRLEGDLFSRAQRCAATLLGGRSLLIETGDYDSETRFVITGRVFVNDRHNADDALLTCPAGVDLAMLDAARLIGRAAEEGYDHAVVVRALNGAAILREEARSGV